MVAPPVRRAKGVAVMFPRMRNIALASIGILVASLGAQRVIADELVDSNSCLNANYKKGQAELIVTASPSGAARLNQVLDQAKLGCVAQLQVDSACLVQIKPGKAKSTSIDSIAEQLRSNIFALSGSVAPKDTQDVIGEVIVNLDFEQPSVDSTTTVEIEDPLFNGQVELQALNAEVAWADARASNVLTAIIDSGVRLDHQDLTGQFLRGTSIGCQAGPCDGTPNHADFNKHHGTRVAGILAAKKGNPFGGVGVAWNTKFMSIYYGPVVDQYRMSCALQYAISKNVDIVNAIWTGGKEPGEYQRYPWDVFEQYVRLAQSREMLIVFAAGNEGVDLDFETRYPVNLKLPNVLVAMEFDVSADEGPDSNFGHATVHIAAPNHASVTTCIESTDCYVETEEPGSSWSAAYVSGAAALLKSRYPHMGYDFLKWRIVANATPDARLTALNQSGGRLNLVGTIYPITAWHGFLSRTQGSPIIWKSGIRADMCASVSIEGREVSGATLGNYFQILANTPNDGVEELPHAAIAAVTQNKLQLRVKCPGSGPIAESLPLLLN